MLRRLTAIAALIICSSSNATIIDLGNITRDTSSGLDWLDVTQTRGLSYDYITSQMGVGGDYEGWRYATTQELDQLIVNFGYSAVNNNCSTGAGHCDFNISGDNQLIETMIRTLGDTYRASADEVGLSIHAPEDGNGYTWGRLDSFTYGFIRDYERVYRDTGLLYDDEDDWVTTSYASYDYRASASFIGSFLVAPTTVPAPATVWLFCSALIGLVVFKRKK